MERIRKFNEGFSGFSVVDSDTAADALSDVVKSIIKSLKSEEKEKHSSYNTHGTLNVAMILVENFKKLIETDDSMWEYGKTVADNLEKEIDKFKKKDDFEKSYLAACKQFVNKLRKILDNSK